MLATIYRQHNERAVVLKQKQGNFHSKQSFQLMKNFLQ
jgi:hypothetical protein